MILFDLDGTLVDTTDLILQSFVHTFDVHTPGRAPSREALIATFGRSLPATLREMAREEGAADPEAWATEMLATYRAFQRERHDAMIRPFDGVEDMLRALKADGHRLGVVTSKMEGFARRGLRVFGLEDYFEIGVFHDDTTTHKPDPAPLILAAARRRVRRSSRRSDAPCRPPSGRWGARKARRIPKPGPRRCWPRTGRSSAIATIR